MPDGRAHWSIPRIPNFCHQRVSDMRVALRIALFFQAIFLCISTAHASVGLAEIPAEPEAGLVTVFYPSTSESRLRRRAGFDLDVALDGDPAVGNRRLVVISHGSPASPWVYFDLARVLVEAGFVVAMPEHFADNYKDDSEPGPPSWKRRPLEVSRAIDHIGADPRFRALLDIEKVGMYGMSAGGHTALVLAGGRWSPARLRQHCDVHMRDDFQACAGPTVRLSGGALDGIKIGLVRWILGFKLTDESWYAHTDPRIAAIVAGVPFAADFDPASLASPVVPLGIITAQQDKWLNPTYHSGAVLKACASCERLADLQTGGHGALLSPLPSGLNGSIGALVADPPGFDRASVVPEINREIAAFFRGICLLPGLHKHRVSRVHQHRMGKNQNDSCNGMGALCARHRAYRLWARRVQGARVATHGILVPDLRSLAHACGSRSPACCCNRRPVLLGIVGTYAFVTSLIGVAAFPKSPFIASLLVSALLNGAVYGLV
ncbi:dienelactone hydrolase [Noviherbaspirillum sp.]|uniref:alpha/beta hydrolase family protein n=1 Tax=Noviherbaspirillum sp. TaxID=1926288 RepID=UPI002B486657|nr:dienelactone hydrolase [Noviherbaspirillum sp.]HJV81074.1 dienelactone hydrolase [Noviherbaspirillum sp.]